MYIENSENEKSCLRKNDGYNFWLALTIFGLILGLLNILAFNLPNSVNIYRGLSILICGFIFFISLTKFVEKCVLSTKLGLRFLKKHHLSVSDALDLINRIVSIIQATMCVMVGVCVCTWTCSGNVLEAREPPVALFYVYFMAAYFLYDIFELYRVWNAKLLDRLKPSQELIDWDSDVTNLSDLIPSLKNGNLTIFKSFEFMKQQIPSFIRYTTKEPMIVFHHIFGSLLGIVIFSNLRTTFGDCSVTFVLWMEISTPFLHARAILAMMNLKQHQIYLWNGLIIITTFFLFRIALIPALIALYSHFTNNSITTTIFEMSIPIKISILIMFSLQFYWFCLIIRITIRSLRNQHYQRNKTSNSNNNNNLETGTTTTTTDTLEIDLA